MPPETLATEAAATTTDGSSTSQTTAAATTENTSLVTDATAAAATPAQTTDAAKAEEGAKTEGEKAPEGAPEKYEFKAQEGKELDANLVSAFSEVARDLDLPQEAAQKMLDKMGDSIVRQREEAHVKAKSEWETASRTDKEIGGDAFDANLGVAKKALGAFGSPELNKLLNDTGLGSHSAIIRFAYKAGKAISEDKMVTGGTGASGESKTVAQRMYPDMNP